jgi:hypothetical protein
MGDRGSILKKCAGSKDGLVGVYLMVLGRFNSGFKAWYVRFVCRVLGTGQDGRCNPAAFIPPAKRRLDLVMRPGPCVRVVGLYRT